MTTLAITGAGMITAAGNDPASAWRALSAASPLGSTGGDGLVEAAIGTFDPKAHIARKGVRDLSRTSQLACAAAATSAAGLASVAAEGVGIVLGSAWGATQTVIDFEREAHVQGPRFVDPILFTETVSNVPAGQIAIHYGWSAFNATVSTGSSSGLSALRLAAALLAESRAAAVVAGGADEMNRPVLQALGDGRPKRSGEGACLLTIESGDHARARGARPSAWWLSSAERYVSPASGEGAADRALSEVIEQLLRRASQPPGSIDLVASGAQGVSEIARDTRAVAAILCSAGPAPRLLFPKTVFGETWGASGPLAVVCAIEALRESGAGSNAMILDRTASGHLIGCIVSLEEPGAR